MDENTILSSNPDPLGELDPVYRHSRREATFILVVWSCCLVYTCTYCYLRGYLSHEPHPQPTGPALGALVGPLEGFNRDPATLTTPLGLGIPDWIFYGVAIPWVVCIVITFWFCIYYFVEDDLGQDEVPDTGVTDPLREQQDG